MSSVPKAGPIDGTDTKCQSNLPQRDENNAFSAVNKVHAASEKQLTKGKEVAPPSKQFSGRQAETEMPLYIKIFAIIFVMLLFGAPLAAAQRPIPRVPNAPRPPAEPQNARAQTSNAETSTDQLPVCGPEAVPPNSIVNHGTGYMRICSNDGACCQIPPKKG